MEVLINCIVEYAAIWAPALTAIIGVVAVFIKAFSKIKEAVKEVKDEQTFKELKAEIETQNNLIREQEQTMNLLLDKLTHVENYKKEKWNGK